METLIYLDNAATTRQKPQQVIDAVVSAMTTMGNAARGAHGSALQAARGIYEARSALAALFGCPRADHVAFTSNSTEALNIAIRGTISPGDHVISTDLEHNSVLRPLYRLEEQGAILSFLQADRLGRIDCADLERLIRPNTKAIVCTHASNLTGEVVDLAKVGAIAKKHGILLIVDAAQTAGCLPIDMEAMGIDILCFTGHKGLMGPQGTGGLCIREGVEIRPFKVGGSGIRSYSRTQPEAYPTRLEAGTLNSHGIAGLAAGVAFIRQIGADTIHRHEQVLLERFYEGIRAVDGVTVYGDFTSGRARTAVIALNIRDYDSGEVADRLSQCYDIAVRAGAHCAPRMHAALGTVEQGAVRFSFSWFTTMAEIDAAIEAVREIAHP